MSSCMPVPESAEDVVALEDVSISLHLYSFSNRMVCIPCNPGKSFVVKSYILLNARRHSCWMSSSSYNFGLLSPILSCTCGVGTQRH